jgi:hypothetical protein
MLYCKCGLVAYFSKLNKRITQTFTWARSLSHQKNRDLSLQASVPDAWPERGVSWTDITQFLSSVAGTLVCKLISFGNRIIRPDQVGLFLGLIINWISKSVQRSNVEMHSIETMKFYITMAIIQALSSVSDAKQTRVACCRQKGTCLRFEKAGHTSYKSSYAHNHEQVRALEGL